MEEKKKEYDIDQRMDELREEEERAKEYRKEKKKVTLIYILASNLVQ
jgi:U4/U6.U5 tri-snRNP component SNU23